MNESHPSMRHTGCTFSKRTQNYHSTCKLGSYINNVVFVGTSLSEYALLIASGIVAYHFIPRSCSRMNAVLLVNAPCAHLQRFCACGYSGSLPTRVIQNPILWWKLAESVAWQRTAYLSSVRDCFLEGWVNVISCMENTIWNIIFNKRKLIRIRGTIWQKKAVWLTKLWWNTENRNTTYLKRISDKN
jgi:hypothetical protein